jgi:hypothetical protein
LNVLQTTGLHHGLLESVLDDDDRGPDGFLVISRVSREIAEEGAKGIGTSRVILKLQVDVPKATFMADGREVLPGRRRRR